MDESFDSSVVPGSLTSDDRVSRFDRVFFVEKTKIFRLYSTSKHWKMVMKIRKALLKWWPTAFILQTQQFSVNGKLFLRNTSRIFKFMVRFYLSDLQLSMNYFIGDVSGYTLRQDIPEGRSVSSKLLASHDAIRQKLLQVQFYSRKW